MSIHYWYIFGYFLAARVRELTLSVLAALLPLLPADDVPFFPLGSSAFLGRPADFLAGLSPVSCFLASLSALVGGTLRFDPAFASDASMSSAMVSSSSSFLSVPSLPFSSSVSSV